MSDVVENPDDRFSHNESLMLLVHFSCADDGSTIPQVVMRNACFLTFDDNNFETEQVKTLVATVTNIKKSENVVATLRVMASLLLDGQELHSELVKEYSVSFSLR